MDPEEGGSLPRLFRPKTGSMASWNAAYVRVEDYLRAHRIHNRLHQSRIIQRVLERAAAKAESHRELDPTVLASEEMGALMDTWFAAVLEEEGQPTDRVAVDGRVSLLLCDGPARWPYVFLDKEHAPKDFLEAMRTTHLNAGPDMARSSMVPRPSDLGPITEAAGETLERFERWPVLRALLLWLLFAGALGTIFYATR